MSVERSETRIDIFPFPLEMFPGLWSLKGKSPSIASLLLEVRPLLLPRVPYPHPSSGHQPQLLRLLREAFSIAVSTQRENGCSCHGYDLHSSRPLRSALPGSHPRKDSEKCLFNSSVLASRSSWLIGSCVCARDPKRLTSDHHPLLRYLQSWSWKIVLVLMSLNLVAQIEFKGPAEKALSSSFFFPWPCSNLKILAASRSYL